MKPLDKQGFSTDREQIRRNAEDAIAGEWATGGMAEHCLVLLAKLEQADNLAEAARNVSGLGIGAWPELAVALAEWEQDA